MANTGDEDLDQELFAFAQDGVESEEEGEASSHHSMGSRSPSRSPPRSPLPDRIASRSRSPRRSPRRSSVSDRYPQPMSQSDRPASQSRGTARRKDESEEEGEASPGPGSPDSMGSVAMDESDSEGSDSGAVGGAAGETAFEREKRLAEQAEREEERAKTAKLKALLGAKADSKSSKRKADADEDDFGARSSRLRSKKDDASSRRPVRRRGLSDTPPVDSFVDEKQTPRNDGKQPGTLQEYERVRMGRSRFAKVCFTPGFEDTFQGAFARVCSSQDPMTGQNTYRMCQIKDFKKGRPYKLDGGEGNVYMTDQYIIASYGTLDKEYPFNACSDSRFSEDEFQRRVQTLETASQKITTSAFLANKCRTINEFLDKPHTSAEISQKIANQNRLAHLMTSNGPMTAVGPQTLQRDLAMHKRNIENRKLNEEQVRKALIADRRKRVALAESNARKLREDAERKQKAEEDELFGGGGGDGDASGVAAAANSNGTTHGAGQPTAVSKYVHRDYKSGSNEFTRAKTDDEIIASMDLGIDIDIEV